VDKVLKTLGKLEPQTTLEITANPTDQSAEDDFLKNTLNLEIKNKNQMIHQRTSLGVFFSSGSEIEGNTIRFEDVMKDSGIIDTYLMNDPYTHSSITAMLVNDINYYFANCSFTWEEAPKEDENY